MIFLLIELILNKTQYSIHLPFIKQVFVALLESENRKTVCIFFFLGNYIVIQSNLFWILPEFGKVQPNVFLKKFLCLFQITMKLRNTRILKQGVKIQMC